MSSSSAATINAANCTQAAVQSAINSAANGDTVNVPACSATWSSVVTGSKAIYLLGAGRDSTVITCADTGLDGGAGGCLQIVPDGTAITNENTLKIDGFTFQGLRNSASNKLVKIYGAGSGSIKAFKNLIFINNRLQNTHNQTSDSGALYLRGQLRGVISNNIFTDCNVLVKAMGNNDSTDPAATFVPASQEWENDAFGGSLAFGTPDNLYLETNSFSWTASWQGGGDPGWIEVGQGGRLAVRYNVWNGANASVPELVDTHGFQNWKPGPVGTGHGGQTGTMLFEFYGNTSTNCPNSRMNSHRGSWALFHNNILSGSAVTVHASQYGNGDVGGSGCNEAVDRRSPGENYNTEINNTYVWNNTIGGTLRNMSLNGALPDHCGITENTNFWNYNAACDGGTCSSGIGRGTTTPSGNCTTGTGYWKASTATPTTSSAIIQGGEFYQCVSTNNWQKIYSPYFYPHPLIGGTPAPTATPGPTPTPTGTPGPTGTPTPTPTATPTPAPGSIVELTAQRVASGNKTTDSATQAYPGSVTAGNLLRVKGPCQKTGAAPTSITVTAGCVSGSFTTIPGPTPSGSDQTFRTFIAYAVATSSGACTVTVNPEGSTGSYEWTQTELVNVNQASPLDVDGGGSEGTMTGAGSATDSILPVANAWIDAIMTHGNSNVTLTAQTDWTTDLDQEVNAGRQAAHGIYRLITTSQSYTAGVDYSAGSTGPKWVMQTVSFKPASIPTPTPSGRLLLFRH